MSLEKKSKKELVEEIKWLQEEVKWRTQVMRKHPLGLVAFRLEGDTIESFRVLSFNEAGEATAPQTENDVAGKMFKDVFPEWMESDFPKLYLQIVLSKEVKHFEYSLPDLETGEILDWRMTAYPWGEKGVSLVYQDITKEKEAERALKEKLETIEAQQNAIRELSTPIIPIMEQIIVVPLVGHIDSGRAKELMRALLAGISEHRAKVVIIDITGVPFVDTGVVNHLDKTIQAARLKGARTIITGISDVVAETIVDLGIDWHQTQTLRDLQTGLLVAFKSVGLQVQR